MFCLVDPCFREGVRTRRFGRDLYGPHVSFLPKHVELIGKYPVSVADEKTGLHADVLQPHGSVSGLLHHPFGIRMIGSGTAMDKILSRVERGTSEHSRKNPLS